MNVATNDDDLRAMQREAIQPAAPRPTCGPIGLCHRYCHLRLQRVLYLNPARTRATHTLRSRPESKNETARADRQHTAQGGRTAHSTNGAEMAHGLRQRAEGDAAGPLQHVCGATRALPKETRRPKQDGCDLTAGGKNLVKRRPSPELHSV